MAHVSTRISRLARAGAIGALLTGAAGAAFPHVAHAATMGGLAVRPATFDANDPATRAYAAHPFF